MPGQPGRNSDIGGEASISDDEVDDANAPERSKLHQGLQSLKDTSSRFAIFAEREYRQIKKLIRSQIGIGGKHFILSKDLYVLQSDPRVRLGRIFSSAMPCASSK